MIISCILTLHHYLPPQQKDLQPNPFQIPPPFFLNLWVFVSVIQLFVILSAARLFSGSYVLNAGGGGKKSALCKRERERERWSIVSMCVAYAIQLCAQTPLGTFFFLFSFLFLMERSIIGRSVIIVNDERARSRFVQVRRRERASRVIALFTLLETCESK